MASIPGPAAADEPSSGGLQLLGRHRALFTNFFRRELFSRYLGSVSGLAWALLHPLALLGVYHFVFTKEPMTGFNSGSPRPATGAPTRMSS